MAYRESGEFNLLGRQFGSQDALFVLAILTILSILFLAFGIRDLYLYMLNRKD